MLSIKEYDEEFSRFIKTEEAEIFGVPGTNRRD
jgi:hypothetical protein